MRFLVFGVVLLTAAVAWAQQPPAMDSPDVQRVASQLNQVACQAVTMTSAQTIAGLQKQITDLKAENERLKDPPKSGATKH
jgi:TolA-binding protein